jgi:hypothetical protein
MEKDLLAKLGSKTISKPQLLRIVEADFSLIPTLLDGTSAPKATVRYGCGSVLVDLTAKHPDKLYPYMDKFITLLDSKHRILTWNAMAAIANLTAVDFDRKFDAAFDKYYGFLGSEYMVTVANVVENSPKIALAKPYLANKITSELLKVQNLKLTPHLTEECRRVLAEHALEAFDGFFDLVEDKEAVLAFAKLYADSSRISLRKEAQGLLKKWVS